MIDAHLHLHDEAFKDDINEVLLRARKSGVVAFVNTSTNFKDAVACLNFSRIYDSVYPCVGLAPYSDLTEIDSMLQLIEDEPDIVAVGEIGLDWPYEKKPAQIEIFKKQIEIAKELDLPVVVHSRSAGKYCIEILKEMKVEKVLLHSFDGGIKHARVAFDLGYHFSIPVTVIKSPQKQQLAKEIPEKLLLLETDSPVLNPNGGRNEPANLVISRDFIAELKGLEPKTIESITEVNTRKFFKI